ncbi:MAG: hypothetical protein GY930_22065 [bacterium]|nr:hypothetical protein [bacterium]
MSSPSPDKKHICERVRASLSSFYDSRSRNGPAIRAHLKTCPGCRRELWILEELSKLTSALPLQNTRPGLAERVRAQAAGDGANFRLQVQVAAACMILAASTWAAFELGHRRGFGLGSQHVGDLAQAPAPEIAQVPIPTPEVPSNPTVEATDEPDKLVRVMDDLVGHGPQEPLSRPLTLTRADEDALRAARSTLADLELIESVPADLRSPLLASQVRYFELEEWARGVDAQSREHPAADVAALVHRLVTAIDDGLPPAELTSLRSAAARPETWTLAGGLHPVDGGHARLRNRGIVVDELRDVAQPKTRESIEEWLAFKDGWVQSGEDLSGMVELIEALETSGMIEASGSTGSNRGPEFVLPDLEDLWSGMEWTDDGNGNLKGEIHTESSGADGHSTFHLEVHRSSSNPSISSSSSSGSSSSNSSKD